MLHDAHCPGEAAACLRHPAGLCGPAVMTKPALLFLSPLMPAEGGNGLAMRAGATLEALAARYEVHLLVIPLAGGAASTPACVRDSCARVLVHPAGRHVDPLFRLIAG